MERIKAYIIEALEKKFNEKREFVDNKEYLNVIKDIIEKGDINSDCNDGDNQWKGEFDLLFDFLYDNASSISVFDEEHYNPIYVKYENKLIELFEIHGQGCYRRIRVLNDEGLIKYHTDFEDIIEAV